MGLIGRKVLIMENGKQVEKENEIRYYRRSYNVGSFESFANWFGQEDIENESLSVNMPL